MKKKKRDPIICPETNERVNTYAAYLQTAWWKKFRQRALRYHGKRCSICGTNQRLQVHHLHYKNVGNEKMEDVKILCATCHHWTHRFKGYGVLRKHVRLSWWVWLIVASVVYAVWIYGE